MANTYEAIATVTVGSGGAADIQFTSIPQTYTDLVLSLSLRDSDTGGDWSEASIKPNGATTNRSARSVYGTGSAAGSDNNTAIYAWISNANNTANTFGNATVYMPNYTSSNAKSMSIDSVTENNATAALAVLNAALWNDSAAITSITITPEVANFAQHSTATLYGIKKN
jgi:hypothetical protein